MLGLLERDVRELTQQVRHHAAVQPADRRVVRAPATRRPGERVTDAQAPWRVVQRLGWQVIPHG
jgi:hypothetical protein